MDAKIQKAAKEGNIYAMLAIAYMYQKGKDTDLSPADAVIWYERSAAAGCSRAKWELAKMYRFSEVPDPGRQKYIYWLRPPRMQAYRRPGGNCPPGTSTAAFCRKTRRSPCTG